MKTQKTMEPEESKGGIADLIKKLQATCGSENLDALSVDDRAGFLLITVSVEPDNLYRTQGYSVGGKKIRTAIVKSLLNNEIFCQHIKDEAEEILLKHLKAELVLNAKGNA
jgi:hypothetical protein